MAELEPGSVECIITSPPYFRLRDYQVTGQLGAEAAVDDWVAGLLPVAEQAARVLVPTGTFWLNVGDTCSTHIREGAPKKSLVLGPERLVLALAERGWIVRNKIVWAKTNAIPSSVTDRLSCAYEVIYLLTRSPHYFFDLDAIRQEPKTGCGGAGGHTGRPSHPSRPPRQPRGQHRAGVAPGRGQSSPAGWGLSKHGGHTGRGLPEAWRGQNADSDHGLYAMKRQKTTSYPSAKTTDVWHLATSQYRGNHFATFPQLWQNAWC